MGTSRRTMFPYEDDSGRNDFRLLRQDESRSVTATVALRSSIDAADDY
jgi:hypothetical protein